MKKHFNQSPLWRLVKKLLFSLAVISLVVAGCKDLVDDINLQIDNQEQSNAFALGQPLGTVEFADLNEASGLANSRSNPDFFWSHNDSGGDSRFFLVSIAGADSGKYVLDGAENFDWEDMAIGAGPVDNLTYLYAADIGDNFAKRESLTIYRTPEPDVSIRFKTINSGGSPRQVQIDLPADTILGNIEVINFVYEDGARDAETMMVDPLTKDIFVVSKREASVIVYTLPFPQNLTEMDTAERVTVLPITQVTSGDISSNGNEILIKNYLNVYRFVRNVGQSIGETLSQEPERLPYNREPQGEAIAWDSNGQNYYTITESANAQPVVLLEYRRN